MCLFPKIPDTNDPKLKNEFVKEQRRHVVDVLSIFVAFIFAIAAFAAMFLGSKLGLTDTDRECIHITLAAVLGAVVGRLTGDRK